MIEIVLNGAKFNVPVKSLSELKELALGDKESEIYKFLEKFNATKPDIFIVDGFAIKEDSELKDGSNVVFIRRGVMPEREILRSMIASRNSPELNLALSKAIIGRGWTWRTWLKYRPKSSQSWRQKASACRL